MSQMGQGCASWADRLDYRVPPCSGESSCVADRVDRVGRTARQIGVELWGQGRTMVLRAIDYGFSNRVAVSCARLVNDRSKNGSYTKRLGGIRERSIGGMDGKKYWRIDKKQRALSRWMSFWGILPGAISRRPLTTHGLADVRGKWSRQRSDEGCENDEVFGLKHAGRPQVEGQARQRSWGRLGASADGAVWRLQEAM